MTAKRKVRVLRAIETVMPFGAGAIVDIAGDSLITLDASWWPKNSPALSCARLERALRVSSLKSPPSAPSRPGKNSMALTFQRFPAWLFCQNCRALWRLRSEDEASGDPRCKKCKGPLVPMRFVAICESGSHIQDIPWGWWVHRGAESLEAKKCKDDGNLYFTTAVGSGEGLASLQVRCRSCDAHRNLGQLSGREALKREGLTCDGRQPWQSQSETGCDSTLHVVQRGATNVHMPEIWSAIDIPEALPQAALHADAIRAHVYFAMLRDDPNGPGAEIALDKISEDLNVARSLVEEVAAAGSASADDLAAAARGTLLEEEWAAFQGVIDGSLDNTADFVAETTPLLSGDDSVPLTSLGSYVSAVVLVERLREVRAMKEFRRYSAEAKPVSANLGASHFEFWYPAVETFGEGVFFSIDEEALRSWEKRPEVASRIEVLRKRADASPIGSRHEPVAARTVMLHTLSHLLMRRLAFNSGYGAASLRERVYGSDEGARAGVLIFTASGDSEGTLGGLVRQGHAPNFGRLVLSAIEDAEWCSNDPVCGESRGQGMNALNLAACHACALSPETSCDRSNLFLDRVLVVGDADTPGFFDDTMRLAREQLSEAQNNGAR